MYIRAALGILLASLSMHTSQGIGATWPVAGGESLNPPTSPYGPRCGSECGGSQHFHAGVDIDVSGDVGSATRKILAAASGRVVTVGYWGALDYTIVVAHPSVSPTSFTGYHHIQSPSDILVSIGQTVSEGEHLANITSGPGDHLHLNYWIQTGTPSSGAGTRHPYRLLQRGGLYKLDAIGMSPVSAILVDHVGTFLRLHVGVGWDPYGAPSALHVFDYENEVRNWNPQTGDLQLGQCYYGATNALGVSPTCFNHGSSGDCETTALGTCTRTYFTFPVDASGDQYILPAPWTYAEDALGNRLYLSDAVTGFFTSTRARVDGRTVTLSWSVSQPTSSVEFEVLRGKTPDELRGIELAVISTDGLNFETALSESPGSTAYYQISHKDGDAVILSLVMRIDVPASTYLDLSSPMPNPGSMETVFNFGVPAGDSFELVIYDVAGRRIRALASGVSDGSPARAVWRLDSRDGSSVAAGIYFARLTSEGAPGVTRKVTVLR